MPESSGPRWQIKRVVGLPGDCVSLQDGLLFINGARHVEPYLRGLPAALGAFSESWRVGDRQVFVMGDSRAHSTDSRQWGAIPAARVVGTAALRVWPPGRLPR